MACLLGLMRPSMVAVMEDGVKARRPLRTRERAWARRSAAALARAGLRPNAISLLSIAAAVLAGAALLLTPGAGAVWGAVLFLAAALFIQLRLLCNLLDGLVAVEGGLGSKSGELFNDAPDRLADAVIFIAAGYALPWPVWGGVLGWAAALVAVLTAYVRLLGGSLGLRQDFCGPMAKQHRMALLTAACLLSVVEGAVAAEPGRVLGLALLLVVVGGIVTIGRRLLRIRTALEAA